MHTFSRQLCTPLFKSVVNNAKARPGRVSRVPAASYQASQKRSFSQSNVLLQQESQRPTQPRIKDTPRPPTRKSNRTPKSSLLRVAVEAQTTRTNTSHLQDTSTNNEKRNSTVTAISVADQFDMEVVSRVLRSHGFPIDPDGTGFEADQVIHTRGANSGDIFVFPSGSIVAWSLPEDVVINLATQTLLPAALNPHIAQTELENLEYEEDPKRDSSSIKGDIILLGTKLQSQAESK